MYRSDKEIRDPAWIASVLQKAGYCHLALSNGDQPYVIPMNFVFSENRLILHSGAEGEKISILQKNPKVSFAVETGIEPVTSETPCGYSMRFRSVCGQGVVKFVEDVGEKRNLLRILAEKYMAGPVPDFSSDAISHVLVIEVKITSMVGKNSGYLVS